MKPKVPFLFVLMAAVLWGTTGTSQTFAPASAHPVAIGTIRLVIGGVTLLAIVLSLKKLSLTNWPYKRTLIASLCMACYQPLFFSSVSITGVAVGTVVGIGSAPVLSGILEWLFWKKNPSKVWWSATLLSIFGCVLLFVNKEAVSINPYGIIMAIGAGLSFALFTLVSKDLTAEKEPLPAMAVIFTISGLMLAPLLFFFDITWIFEANGALVSLELGIFATGIAYWLYAKGLKKIPSSTAVTLSLGEPLTATVLGVFVVGEVLSVPSWIGVFLILLGLCVLSFVKEKTVQQVSYRENQLLP
ncbi:EamA family transporter [Salirhabdus sp. Marseille-P4669]|uniref:EamA family transporter n=1 Tax=Salirhabdus sp. Marseille-P4669 TaxID=2042310 RepID=UPI000C79D561|nr:EamA family transporter [Salirhabdus sp. Marseille-P4669]